jgi:hypothetical protein
VGRKRCIQGHVSQVQRHHLWTAWMSVGRSYTSHSGPTALLCPILHTYYCTPTFQPFGSLLTDPSRRQLRSEFMLVKYPCRSV